MDVQWMKWTDVYALGVRADASMRSVDAGVCPTPGCAKPYLSEQQPGTPFYGAGTGLVVAWVVKNRVFLYLKSELGFLASSSSRWWVLLDMHCATETCNLALSASQSLWSAKRCITHH